MKRAISDWLIVLASLLDDVAVALFILFILWLLKVPISMSIIIFLILFFIAFTLVVHKLVIPALHKKPTTGAEGMIGVEGEVVEPLMPKGLISVRGEYWQARSVGENIAVGEIVEIVAIEGLTTKVKLK
ncbi:NfeD family protein [Chloroflexota bacterium]